jgi:hypothetical protein
MALLNIGELANTLDFDFYTEYSQSLGGMSLALEMRRRMGALS